MEVSRLARVRRVAHRCWDANPVSRIGPTRSGGAGACGAGERVSHLHPDVGVRAGRHGCMCTEGL